MKCPFPTLFLLGFFASTSAFLAPSVPHRLCATSSTNGGHHVCFSQPQPLAIRVRGTSLKMAQDGDEGNIDDKLKEIQNSAGSSLDKAMADEEQYKAMAMEAARKRVEELKEKAKNMPKPPERKPTELTDSPSFISQSPRLLCQRLQPCFEPAAI